MLSLYLDDSGTHAGAPVLSLGGYLAPDELWERFEVEWRQALDDYGISWFHMTDFENRQKQFAGWPERRRVPRFSRLLTIINRHVGASVGMSIECRAFEELAPPALQTVLGGAYGLAVRACLASVKRLANPPCQDR